MKTPLILSLILVSLSASAPLNAKNKSEPPTTVILTVFKYSEAGVRARMILNGHQFDCFAAVGRGDESSRSFETPSGNDFHVFATDTIPLARLGHLEQRIFFARTHGIDVTIRAQRPYERLGGHTTQGGVTLPLKEFNLLWFAAHRGQPIIVQVLD